LKIGDKEIPEIIFDLELGERPGWEADSVRGA
jgi:hypothetical protein